MLDHGISTHLSEPIARVTSEEDRRRVREHLKIVLADPLFSNSKRLPAFLRHVVSEALEGVHVGDEVASAARQLSKKQQALVGCSHFALSLHVAGHRSAVN